MHVKWLIATIKPGYAAQNDDAVWKEYFTAVRRPKLKPFSSSTSPEVAFSLFQTIVTDIQIKPVKLTLEEAAFYYESLINVGGVTDQQADVSEQETSERARAGRFDNGRMPDARQRVYLSAGDFRGSEVFPGL